MSKSFSAKVYAVVKKIPRGKVATYQDIAILAGNPNAPRAVGTAMKNNPDIKTIPCHRVVGSDGKMHGYSAKQGISSKKKMLKKEGVQFNGERVILSTFRWKKVE